MIAAPNVNAIGNTKPMEIWSIRFCAIIGGIGTAIGLVLGYAISFLADRYHWLALDQEVYSLAYVPLESNWTDAIWIAAAAMGVSLLATIYPARSATRISPVESMRYE